MATESTRINTDNDIAASIIEAVADAKGVDPIHLDIVLHDYIEPDALNRLVAHDSGTWTLSVELPEHTVTVTSDCVVLVDGNEKCVLSAQ